MLFINPDSDHIKEALKEHKRVIKCRVFRKLDVYCLIKGCSTCKAHTLTFKSLASIENKVKNYLLKNDNLEDLICAKPNQMKSLSDAFFKNVLPQNDYNQLENYFEIKTKKEKETKHGIIFNLIVDLGKLFDYDWLCDKAPIEEYSLYKLAQNLNRRSCTYCNRTYTTTMTTSKKGKLMRPQFDHWYPKWKYPLLALSFFNLIPSCSTCNSSSKGRDELDLQKNIHPYIESDQENEFSFSYINSKVNKYHVYVRAHNTNKKALKTIKALNIDTMYNAHIPELEDLIKIKKAYTENYIDKLNKFFPKSSLTNEDIYRLAFGTEINFKDFHKRPLSKFKNDILKELGIIKKNDE
jgi:hypothetical protein